MIFHNQYCAHFLSISSITQQFMNFIYQMNDRSYHKTQIRINVLIKLSMLIIAATCKTFRHSLLSSSSSSWKFPKLDKIPEMSSLWKSNLGYFQYTTCLPYYPEKWRDVLFRNWYRVDAHWLILFILLHT